MGTSWLFIYVECSLIAFDVGFFVGLSGKLFLFMFIFYVVCRKRHKDDCLCAICIMKRRRREREEKARVLKEQMRATEKSMAQSRQEVNALSTNDSIILSKMSMTSVVPTYSFFFFIGNLKYKQRILYGPLSYERFHVVDCIFYLLVKLHLLITSTKKEMKIAS